MRAPDFRFKQFSIWHDQCAMKVNTDGILLGAWSNLSSAKSIIDIGSGTGLIALMLAQKASESEQELQIVGVEIDQAAAVQATDNVAQSPWSQQVEIVQRDIQSFSQDCSTKFDLLVSNPPYFTNSLRSLGDARDKARHNDGLSFADLLKSSDILCSESATFNLILPCNEADRLLTLAAEFNWHLNKRCQVSTVTGKAPTRSLLSLTRTKSATPLLSKLIIRDKTNSYTPEFIELCRAYYLAM